MQQISIDITEELENGGKETRTVKGSVLTHPSEITLKRWALYFEELEIQPQWFKDFHDAKEGEREALKKDWTAEQWAQSYVIFAKLGLTFVNSLKLRELIELPIGTGESPDIDSLLGLFLLTVNTVYSYQPKNREYFEHKGRKFKAFVKQNIQGAEYGSDMSVREAINALQIEHSWKNHTSSGANHYNINVGVLTALSREIVEGKVEKPPVDGPAFSQWFQKRQAFFSDIKMDIALDVVFFSMGLKALSRSIPLSLHSLLRPAVAA